MWTELNSMESIYGKDNGEIVADLTIQSRGIRNELRSIEGTKKMQAMQANQFHWN